MTQRMRIQTTGTEKEQAALKMLIGRAQGRRMNPASPVLSQAGA
ncbi:hypothetical protein [Deinococcus sp.]